jgi:tripartite-type tricarboxylate transporter receptor subunit TctC
MPVRLATREMVRIGYRTRRVGRQRHRNRVHYGSEEDAMMNGGCLLIAGAMLLLVASGAGAQSYPAKPIRVIIPAAPGDSCDVLTRIIGPKTGERLGQQFAVDNRAGAGGQLGLTLLAQAPPDGYTLACGQGGNMVIAPVAFQKVPYNTTRDFVPIAQIASNFLALVVHPSVPFKSVKELIAYAKANPGKLTFGTTGEGAFLHFAIERLRTQAGFTYLHVPFKSVSATVTDIMGGRIDATLGSFVSLQTHVASGRLRMLGIARATRVPEYPDIPAIAETVPGYTAGGWYGIVAPAGTPRDIVAMLNRELNRTLREPDVREKMLTYGLEIHNEPPEFFAETIRSDFETWGKLARDIGFKPR